MYKDSYSQRLKEIREKYGSTVKQTTSCLLNQRQQSTTCDSFYDNKYVSKKMAVETFPISKKFSENIDPSGKDMTRKYSTLAHKEKEAQQNFDSFLYTQSKQERLKQIQKIRQSVAQSKKQAIQDWNKQAERSKSKCFQTQKYTGLRERTNTYMAGNPQQNHFRKFKQSTIDYPERNRGLSYKQTKIESNLELDRELRRNYDYSRPDTKKNQQIIDPENNQNRRFESHRKNSVSRFDRDIEASTGGKNFACTTSVELRNTRQIDSQTTSPIRGLMKFDSLQKTKRVESYETQNTLSKFANPSYDLTNIDKIQERIQKILGKK